MKKMKKLALIIAVAGIVGLTSCNKDVVCTLSANGVTATITLTNDNAEVCLDDDCETVEYDATGDVTDKASAQASLEDDGYTCD